ncbi:acetyl-coenzyme A synthetase N-terminal domain-containing protein, partial [Phenylobacterium sp.]
MDAAGYEAAVAQVEADPEAYWRKVASRLDWITPPTQIKDTSFHKHPFHIRWYADG